MCLMVSDYSRCNYAILVLKLSGTLLSQLSHTLLFLNVTQLNLNNVEWCRCVELLRSWM